MRRGGGTNTQMQTKKRQQRKSMANFIRIGLQIDIFMEKSHGQNALLFAHYCHLIVYVFRLLIFHPFAQASIRSKPR